jgi:hypothetical protein
LRRCAFGELESMAVVATRRRRRRFQQLSRSKHVDAVEVRIVAAEILAAAADVILAAMYLRRVGIDGSSYAAAPTQVQQLSRRLRLRHSYRREKKRWGRGGIVPCRPGPSWEIHPGEPPPFLSPHLGLRKKHEISRLFGASRKASKNSPADKNRPMDNKNIR